MHEAQACSLACGAAPHEAAAALGSSPSSRSTLNAHESGAPLPPAAACRLTKHMKALVGGRGGGGGFSAPGSMSLADSLLAPLLTALDTRMGVREALQAAKSQDVMRRAFHLPFSCRWPRWRVWPCLMSWDAKVRRTPTFIEPSRRRTSPGWAMRS